MKYVLIVLSFISCCVCKKQPLSTGFIEPVKIDTASSLAKILDTCKHYYVQTTLLYCYPPGNKCNTSYCMQCGKLWKSN